MLNVESSEDSEREFEEEEFYKLQSTAFNIEVSVQSLVSYLYTYIKALTMPKPFMDKSC